MTLSQNITRAKYVSFLVSFILLLIFFLYVPPEIILISFLLSSILIFGLAYYLQQKVAFLQQKKDLKELKYFLISLYASINAGKSVYESFRDLSKSGYGGLSKLASGVVRYMEEGMPASRAVSLAARGQPAIIQNYFFLISDSMDGGDLREILPILIDEERNRTDLESLRFLETLKGSSVLFLYLAVVFPSLILVAYPITSIIGISISPDFIFLIFFPILPGVVLFLLANLYVRRP